jgi:hypothetical protein
LLSFILFLAHSSETLCLLFYVYTITFLFFLYHQLLQFTTAK